MRNLNRRQGGNASPEQTHHYNLAQQMEELESRRKQNEDLWHELLKTDEELAQQKQATEQTTLELKKQRRENENLLQRLVSAIQSRDSMRGRLGNMTMQRNRALQQVERLTKQNRTVMQELKITTDKLGEAYQQANRIQAEYDQDMTDIAHAYRELSLEQRAQLPEKFRQILDQTEEDYTEVKHETT